MENKNRYMIKEKEIQVVFWEHGNDIVTIIIGGVRFTILKKLLDKIAEPAP